MAAESSKGCSASHSREFLIIRSMCFLVSSVILLTFFETRRKRGSGVTIISMQ